MTRPWTTAERAAQPEGASAPAWARPDALQRRLLYRDALMLIVDKPAGLPVHAGPKGGPSLEALADGLRFGLPRRPELAHRLDRDTSGCLVLGRHRQALRRLGRLFAAGRVGKTYWAVVEGLPPADAGRIELPLARRSPVRGWWMKIDPGGLAAVTEYRVLGHDGARSWLELRPRTGRTHQLRVHLAAVGCPILGDAVYGRAGPAAPSGGHAPAAITATDRDPASMPARVTATERDSASMPAATGRNLAAIPAAITATGRDAPWAPARAASRPGTAIPLHLHARSVTVPLYPSREPITATAPVPAHMEEALRACGFAAAEGGADLPPP